LTCSGWQEEPKKVVGIELVHKAVQDFFKENKLTHSIQESGKLNLFK
jgi:hypothetical protein